MVTPSHAAERFTHPGMTDALVLEGMDLMQRGVQNPGFVESSTEGIHTALQNVAPDVVAPSEEV